MRGSIAVAALGLGCHDAGSERAGPTFYQDVAPVLAERCGACHQPGGAAPFSVLDYATAAEWAEPMGDAVSSGRMPPYFAVDTDECTPRLGFQDDPRLTDDERALVLDWVAAGAPEGDRKDAAPAPVHPGDHLTSPDATLTLQSPFTVEGDRDIYQCFRVPLPPMSGDRWITGLEVLPDNDRVVHHVLVWEDPTDQSASQVGPDGSYPCSGFPDLWPTELAGIWTPGAGAVRTPPGTGTLVHPGGSLVLNVHYHPTGTTTEVDQSSIALQWTDQQPAQYTTWFLIDQPFGAQVQPGPHDRSGPEFRIPANEAHHHETEVLTIPSFIPFDLPIFAITPHMHYLGTAMEVSLERPTGERECLIDTPQYRFDYQTMYAYDDGGEQARLPTARVGDTVTVQCTYDNSTSNRFMPQYLSAAGVDAPQDVYWGEQTSDEMCMAMVGLITPPVDLVSVLGGLF